MPIKSETILVLKAKNNHNVGLFIGRWKDSLLPETDRWPFNDRFDI